MRAKGHSMGEKKPFLSICIPTYNRQKLLARMLSDVLREIRGMQGIEVCISDNGSPDSTPKFLSASYSKPPFRLRLGAKNLGVDANLLALADMARGEYIWYVGDDDNIIKGSLKGFLPILKRRKPDVLYMPYIAMENGKVREMESYGDFFSKDLVMRPHTFVGSIVMRRELFTHIPRQLVEKGLETIHLHSWVLRLNGLYFPSTKLEIIDKPAILNGGSNLFPPVSWELIVHSKVFAKTYLNALFLPSISLSYRLKFLKAYISFVARSFFFLLCERVFRNRLEPIGLKFFATEFGPVWGAALYLWRVLLCCVPRFILTWKLRLMMALLRKTGIVKRNSFEFLRGSWTPKSETSEQRWLEFLHGKK